MRYICLIIIFILFQSCSLLGIQREETPKYSVIIKEGNFEIRQYQPYIVAKTFVKGDFKDSQSIAFRRLAGYIFGKNTSKEKISMTSPVEMKKSSTKIAMTAPVTMAKNQEFHEMTFSMPSKYSINDLPIPEDKEVILEEVPNKLVASIEFSWLASEDKNKEMAKRLKLWLAKKPSYEIISHYIFAGYNPPWTIPFLRKNEVHFIVKKK